MLVARRLLVLTAVALWVGVTLAPGALAAQGTVDACELAIALQEQGRTASAAALRAEMGDRCGPGMPISTVPDVVRVLHAAAGASLEIDPPDTDAAEELLGSAADQISKLPEGVRDTEQGRQLEEKQDQLETALADETDAVLGAVWEETWETLSPLLVILGQLAAFSLVVWFLVRFAGQLDLVSRAWRARIRDEGFWWEGLLAGATLVVMVVAVYNSPRGGSSFAFLLGCCFAAAGLVILYLIEQKSDSDTRWRCLFTLVIAMVACGVVFAVPIGGMWSWSLVLVLLGVLFVTVSLMVHGPHIRFRIDPFVNDKEGTVAGLIQAELRRLGSSSQPAGIDRYEAPEDAIDTVPSGASKLDPAGWIGALVALAAKLVPSRAYRLTGELLPEGGKKVLTLALYRGRRVLEAETMRSETSPPTAPDREKAPAAQSGEGKEADEDPMLPQRLAFGAAAWVALNLAKHADGKIRRPVHGSESWPSSARTAAGLRVPRSDGRSEFAAALDADPRNWVARFELARLDMNAGMHDDAIAWLEDLLRDLEDPEREDPQVDAYHPFRVRYNLAASYFHRVVDPEASDAPEDLEKARARADDLVMEAREALGSRGPLPETSARGRGPVEGAREHDPGQEPEPLCERLQSVPGSGSDLTQWLAREVWEPTTVMLHDVEMWIAARDGDFPSVEEKECACRVTASRTHYNVACYYSNRARLYEERQPNDWQARHDRVLANALKHLEAALQGRHTSEGPLWVKAVRDPSLGYLCRARRQEFEELVTRYGGKIEKKPLLAGFAGLSEKQARALWSLRPPDTVLTAEDLVRKACSASLRRELTEKSGVPSPVLYRAAQLAEVVIRRPLAKDYGALLFRAGLGSLDALGRVPATVDWAVIVRERLRRNGNRDVQRLPTIETVLGWIGDNAPDSGVTAG